jgi:hypothetical protein
LVSFRDSSAAKVESIMHSASPQPYIHAHLSFSLVQCYRGFRQFYIVRLFSYPTMVTIIPSRCIILIFLSTTVANRSTMHAQGLLLNTHSVDPCTSTVALICVAHQVVAQSYVAMPLSAFVRRHLVRRAALSLTSRSEFNLKSQLARSTYSVYRKRDSPLPYHFSANAHRTPHAYVPPGLRLKWLSSGGSFCNIYIGFLGAHLPASVALKIVRSKIR